MQWVVKYIFWGIYQVKMLSKMATRKQQRYMQMYRVSLLLYLGYVLNCMKIKYIFLLKELMPFIDYHALRIQAKWCKQKE